MSSKTATVACANCGALNGNDFDRCIRCNEPLRGAAPAEKATRRVPARRRPPQAPGPGSEPLLGRFPAETLPAAKLLVALNALVFAAQAFTTMSHTKSLGALLTGDRTVRGMLDLMLFGALHPVLAPVEPWRMLSACFVHMGILHIGMNMLGLIYLARLAEPAIGSIRFIIMYTACGVVSFATMAVVYYGSPGASWTAGASGAVFGVMGMVLGFLARRRDPRWKTWLVQAVAYSVAFTLMLPNIAHAAHIGGLLAGVAIGALFAKGAPKPSLPWQRWLAALCLIASLGSLLAARASPYYEEAAKEAAKSAQAAE